MTLVHAVVVGYEDWKLFDKKRKPKELPPEENYAIEIDCKNPRVLQYLLTQMQRFMNDPVIDREVTRILREESRRTAKPDEKKDAMSFMEWLEEYSDKMERGK